MVEVPQYRIDFIPREAGAEAAPLHIWAADVLEAEEFMTNPNDWIPVGISCIDLQGVLLYEHMVDPGDWSRWTNRALMREDNTQ